MLAGPIFGAQILAEFYKVGFSGAQATNLSMAIGIGAITNILATNYYQGQSIGVGTGAGTGTGIISGIVGTITGGLIQSEMIKKNLTGSQSLNFAMAIGIAFANHIKLGVVSSVSTPVANGSGTGTLKGIDGNLLGASILASMTSFALTGSQNLNLSFAIGAGLADSIKMGVITTLIVGAGYPPSPTSGTDIGKMM